jgi:hypothetical protein
MITGIFDGASLTLLTSYFFRALAQLSEHSLPYI